MAEGEGTGRTGDRLKQLRAFCHAARLESMSKAADRLDISQPAVSQHIRALEREFATTFFERRGPRITLTPAGAGLYRLAMPLVQGVERLPETFTEHVNGEATGEVRVLAGLTASTFLLPDYLKRFRATHEGVRVTLRTGGLADGLGLLRDREVDFALGGVETVPELLAFHPFRTCHYVLIAPRGHPLTKGGRTVGARDIAAFPMVMPARGTSAREAGELAARHFGVALEVAVETRGWSVIRQLVERGVGIAFVPDMCVGERDAVRMVPIEERLAQAIRPLSYGVILARPTFLPLAARRLIQTMIPTFPDPPPL